MKIKIDLTPTASVETSPSFQDSCRELWMCRFPFKNGLQQQLEREKTL